MIIYHRNTQNDKIKEIISKINSYVEQAADAALSLSFPANKDSHLDAWREIAEEYLKNPVDFFIVKSQLKKFQLNTRYGYAVERLTYEKIRSEGLPHIDYGYEIEATRGMTRPDIIIFEKSTKVEYAWLDITSFNSEGHIFDKAGSGWDTRPVVCEITYDALVYTNIRKDTLTERDIRTMHRSIDRNRSIFKLAEEKLLGTANMIIIDIIKDDDCTMAVFKREMDRAFFENLSHNILRSIVERMCEQQGLVLGDCLHKLGYPRDKRIGRDAAGLDALIRMWGKV